jgi:hypothetical protein
MSSVNHHAGRTNQARLGKIAILLTVALRIAGAQTQLDLGRQGKNVDFATAQSTRPTQTGTVLPATCSVGQLFYKANAPAGSNLFGCTATDTWTVLGGGVSTSGTQLSDFQTTASGTTLTVGAGCSNTSRCNARFVETTASFSSPATVTVSAGTGTARIYIDGSSTPGALHVRSTGLTLSCAGMNCTTDTGVAFPSNSIPLYTWTATSGVWDPAGGQDFRAFLSSYQVTPGPGIVVSQTGGNAVFTVDTAVVPTFLTASATISTFPSINSGACSADQAFTLSGALTNDGVSPGWPASMTAGLIGMMRISAANTVAVRLCNFSGATLTPASAIYRATIVRSF